MREEIEAAGGQWAVAKGLDDALATLEHWGAIKPDLSMKCQMISGKGVMGGIGSGRYGGYRAATCEDDYAIDLPWLWQEGVLRRLGRDKGKRGHAGNQAALNRGRWKRASWLGNKRVCCGPIEPRVCAFRFMSSNCQKNEAGAL